MSNRQDASVYGDGVLFPQNVVMIHLALDYTFSILLKQAERHGLTEKAGNVAVLLRAPSNPLSNVAKIKKKNNFEY